MQVDITSTGVTQAQLGLRARMLRLEDLRPEMETASDLFYEATRSWYESDGSGTWPALAESTVAQKASQGAGDPGRPLFAEGNLFASATSPSGPYSVHAITGHSALMAVDWNEGGWQIPMVQALGTDPLGPFPRGNHPASWRIPPRPIWPRGHVIDLLQAKIGELFLRGV
jgi:hypothetical protein